jgi:hypothetical protein
LRTRWHNLRRRITKKWMTKTKKRAIVQRNNHKKRMPKTKKGALKLKETITKEGTTKTRKKTT